MAEKIELPVKEYHHPLNSVDNRVWIKFKDVMKLTSRGRKKLTKILYKYQDELDADYGGPVVYPGKTNWSFEKEGTLQWFKENHARVWREDK